MSNTIQPASAREKRIEHEELKPCMAKVDELQAKLHALQLVCGTTDANKFETACDRAIARAEAAEAALKAAQEDAAIIDWLGEHPESLPYLDNGKWIIPYAVSNAGGHGGGVGEYRGRTIREVVKYAAAQQPKGGA